MSTTKDFHDYILECLGSQGDVSTRKMMGEYLIYYKGKLIGDICDNTLLFKITPTSEVLLAECEKAYPYEGSKTLMHVVDNFENTDLMQTVMETLYEELPDNNNNSRSQKNV